ncbi:hypothetical protein [Aeromicrobium erythreum]|jgi:hypothetical protein|uniref:Uncharacterized protein n=1 Tax=Aeromicrobium erythreum TaxID=2041 RepID=A0A0U4CCI9_9ACTN|nr:hypothetical protein [Aeromicrobium erythreum]ALX05566.1 hypothetical protein AERYTH_13100 [Aeromicrobium erythreum]
MKTIDDYIGVLAVTAVTCVVIGYVDSDEAASGAYTLGCVIAIYLLVVYVVRRLRARRPADEPPAT